MPDDARSSRMAETSLNSGAEMCFPKINVVAPFVGSSGHREYLRYTKPSYLQDVSAAPIR